ncbi:MAG: DUF1320 domain-containing protein [Sphingobacteriaceae bacterium]|nr:DUF1320 domain-containing protein [Sphingobacteriaceae bacterium]
MQFLKDTDFDAALKAEIKAMLFDTQKLNIAEGYAIGRLNHYIGGKYDVTKVLNTKKNPSGDDIRDQFIVELLVNITLYRLYTQFAPSKIPETRTSDYDDAIKWLSKVGTGEIPSILPPLETETTQFKINSYPKQNHRF